MKSFIKRLLCRHTLKLVGTFIDCINQEEVIQRPLLRCSLCGKAHVGNGWVDDYRKAHPEDIAARIREVNNG